MPGSRLRQLCAHVSGSVGPGTASARVSGHSGLSLEPPAAAAPVTPAKDEHRRHFLEHGWVKIEDALSIEHDLEPVRAGIDVLLNQQAQAWLEQGYIERVHGDEPFERRLAAVAEQLPDHVFGDATGPGASSRAEGTLAGWARAMDTMNSRLPAIHRLFFSPRLLDCIAAILDTDEISLSPIQHLRPYIRAREPGGRRPWMLHEWHQDMGVTTEEAHGSEIVTCWIPLVNVSRDMGALEIYPDSAAQRELLPTDTGGRGGLIDPAALPTRAPLCVEMNLGDVLLISAFTPHRSTPNLTPLARWSLDLRFQPTGTHSGRGQLPSFTVRSASDPDAVERDRDFDRWCARWAAAT